MYLELGLSYFCCVPNKGNEHQTQRLVLTVIKTEIIPNRLLPHNLRLWSIVYIREGYIVKGFKKLYDGGLDVCSVVGCYHGAGQRLVKFGNVWVW